MFNLDNFTNQNAYEDGDVQEVHNDFEEDGVQEDPLAPEPRNEVAREDINEEDLAGVGLAVDDNSVHTPRFADASREVDNTFMADALNLTEKDLMGSEYLQNVTNRDQLARKASRLIASVIKMDRATLNVDDDSDAGDSDVENNITAQINRLRNGRRTRFTTKRPDKVQYMNHALRQSIGTPRSVSKWTGHEKLFKTATMADTRASKETKQTLNFDKRGNVLFGGHRLVIKSQPRNPDMIAEVSQYDKTKRNKMTTEGLQKFADRATGYVLGKKDKLAVPVINLTDDSAERVMDEVLNLSSKLTTLKTHMHRFDIGDVMEVLVPVDLQHSSALEEVTFNVLSDYPILHPIQVANSITYLRLWVEDKYVTQNLAYTLQLLENNTESRLWHLCLEQYEEFHEAQRGGPLMLLLILRQIQNTSDKALESLKTKLADLKITDIPGEDIDHVVSLIKSTDKVLQTSSHGSRSYTMSDLSKTCVDIFLTCSHPEFTAPFQLIKNETMATADMAGTSPQWPTVTELTTMATYSYARQRQIGWSAAPAKSSAFNAALTPHGPRSGSSGGRSQRKFNCFNCGAEDHMEGDCPKPKDARKIAAARKAFMDKKSASASRPGSSSNRSGGDNKQRRKYHGKPEIMNKKGYWVPDTKKLREQAAAAMSTPPAAPPQSSPPSQSTPAGAQGNVRFSVPTAAMSSPSSTPSTSHSAQLRSILRTAASRSAD